jgi:hypothetical protein
MADPEETTQADPRDETSVDLVIELLSEPLGQDKAQSVVHKNLEAMGLFGRRRLSRSECKQLLDSIGEESGLIAIASRLAKIKLISANTLRE